MKARALQQQESALYELFAKRPEGIKPGLARIHAALACVSWAGAIPPVITIGGTNGKGTTAGMLWHLLAAAGLRAGLFSSPHLCRFSERIQCTHRQINDEILLKELGDLQRELPQEIYESLSFFEVNTLLALQTFIRSDCQLLVLEVGLGGRWDACNIVDSVAAVVTSIDRDHVEYLGSSYGGIGAEKLGIARPQRPLFWGERYTDAKAGLRESLETQQRAREFVLYERGKHFALNGEGSLGISLPDLPQLTLKLPTFFRGFPLLLQENFALSLSVFYWLLFQEKLSPDCRLGEEGISPETFIQQVAARCGAANIPWAASLVGRFQRLRVRDSSASFELISDVSHNPAGIGEFILYLKAQGLINDQGLKIPGFFSCLYDKEVEEMLDEVSRYFSPLLLFQSANPRSFSRQHLAAPYQQLPLFADFSKAWHYAYTNWHAYPQPWALCGSVAALGEVFSYFRAFPPQRSYQQILHGSFAL